MQSAAIQISVTLVFLRNSFALAKRMTSSALTLED